MVLENLPYLVKLSGHLRALILFFVLFIALRLILLICQKLFMKISSKTSTDLDDLLLKKSSGSLSFVALLISLIFALKEIDFTEGVEGVVFRILYSLLAISIGYLIFIFVDIILVGVWKKFAEKTESNIMKF